MNKLYAFFVALLFSPAIFSQSNAVVFHFDHKVGSQNLEIGDSTLFSIWSGKKMYLTRAEFYISEIELTKPDGSKLPLTNQYLLVNANDPDRSYATGSWDVQEIAGLGLHLGVDSAHNHLDPSTYDPGHPLAHQIPPMHWGWAAGYRFMVIEGQIDNNNDGIPETTFQFHNIGDDLYKYAELSGSTTAANGVLDVHITLDYIQLFNKIDMSGNLTLHGNDPFNNSMMENASKQGFMTMAQSSNAQEAGKYNHMVSVAPNPFSSQAVLNYNFPEAKGELQMTITSISGQFIKSYKNLPLQGSLRLDGDILEKGIYQCSFSQNGVILAQKRILVLD